ncbi:MAG: hypothetical protein B6I30_02955 [Desulfobacteraceae bacterium 4572_187]|nr:MAG: hypothetical protein B6I30_02955 [Desulfobacteraceae bacterium 4572_187]
MYLDNFIQGLSLRFAVDQYLELYPILKQSSEFRGNCPFTGRIADVIVNEFWETITFGQLGLEFSGRLLTRKLLQLYMDNGFEPKWRCFDCRKIASENQDAFSRINQQLRNLEKDLLLLLKKVGGRRYENHRDGLDFEPWIEIDYYIGPAHRLYHQDSDNILCRQKFHVGRAENDKFKIEELIYNPGDYRSPLKFDFQECYLFHDLYDHQSCNLEDILLISDIYYSLVMEYQFRKKINLK